MLMQRNDSSGRFFSSSFHMETAWSEHSAVLTKFSKQNKVPKKQHPFHVSGSACPHLSCHVWPKSWHIYPLQWSEISSLHLGDWWADSVCFVPFTSGFYTCWEETSLQGKESECAAIHLQSMPLYPRDFRSACHTHLWACTITYWILFQHSSFDCDPARWAAVTSLFTGLATASNHTEATAMQSWGYLGRKNERETNCSGSMLNKASSLTSQVWWEPSPDSCLAAIQGDFCFP